MNFFSHRHRFEVIRTIWPYEHGFGVRCRSRDCGLILETGLKRRRDAERITRYENKKRPSRLQQVLSFFKG